ncbi:MAG TPA: DegT/DnrJ/EryC1/StrS family aminotransferase [Terriglobales bacterium]|nr:DegT/DnrJ/EryC1/StrS family aminotransferase [Terriglobales bacterium]
MTVRIPLAKPEISDADRDAVLDVLRTSHLSMGPKLAEFEQGICDYIGCRYAVAVNSGTSALQLAVRALELEPSAEVILPSFTFSALLNVILQAGLRPKFVDIDPETYNVTPELVAAAITPRTRLVLAVHTFGFPVDVKLLRQVTERPAQLRAGRHSTSLRAGPHHTIRIIEDACEALGAELQGSKAGGFGDVGLFAFYPNKQITTGEGGVLVTSSQKIASQAAKLRNQGRDPELDWLQHVEAGFSYRLSDINCALGISQLKRIEDIIARRQTLAESYDRELMAVTDVRRPPTKRNVGRISWFVYPVQLTKEFTRADRDAVCASMLRKGIATGRYFAPLHLQPVFAAATWRGAPKLRLPHTEFVADRVITLPFFNQLTEKEIQEVCGGLAESLIEVRRKT